MNSIFLDKIKVHSSWNKFLTKEIIEILVRIESEVVKNDYTPSPEKVLRFLETDLKQIKIIILGQDPYPQSGVATGRAFEVGGLESWNKPFKNISLKNIIRSLYKAYTGKALKFNEIKQKFDNEFPLLSPAKIFGHWEKEGVLLLNTSYTCQIGKPGSHKRIWEEFTEEILKFLRSSNENLTWFLWGNHALNATQELKIKKSIVAHHPMMCFDGPHRDKDFLYGQINCFEQFIPEIDWTGFNLNKNIKTTKGLF